MIDVPGTLIKLGQNPADRFQSCQPQLMYILMVMAGSSRLPRVRKAKDKTKHKIVSLMKWR